MGIYSDSTCGLDLIGAKLPAGRKFRCLGGIFDTWHTIVPKYLSQYFLCVQDIDRESETAVQMLFDMMDGKEIPAGRTALPPQGLLIPDEHQ